MEYRGENILGHRETEGFGCMCGLIEGSSWDWMKIVGCGSLCIEIGYWESYVEWEEWYIEVVV